MRDPSRSAFVVSCADVFSASFLAECCRNSARQLTAPGRN